MQTKKRVRRLGLVVGVLALVTLCWAAPAPAQQPGLVEYRVLVDDHRRPLPGAPPEGWFYNAMGGDRGSINDVADPSGKGVAAFSKPTPTTYRGAVTRLGSGGSQWEYFGWWYALGRPLQQKFQFDPNAIFHRMIKPEYQAQLVGVDVTVAGISSPGGRSDLTLALELKGFDETGAEVVRTARKFVGRDDLTSMSFPHVFSMDLDPANVGLTGLLTVVLDKALPGDSAEIDDVNLRVRMPAVAPEKEPLLFSLAALLNNWDEATGMIQDRSNFPNGDFENLSATAKAAKILACGILAGLIDRTQGIDAIARIANTLLTKVPRGPANLWPHFTRSGGTIRVPGTEWASGDTAYAALDLAVALEMTGDPQSQLPACISFLRSIDWKSLQRPGGGFSHGFADDGSPLPGTWQGFGTETLGVIWAVLAGGGPLGTMDAPPGDNGSGFILHAAYPIVPSAVDRWGNDWLALRREEVGRQLLWYRDSQHPNAKIVALNLFGLSAAESPVGWHADPAQIYHAYGMGGRFSGPDSGENTVVAPHYSGMVASLTPSSLKMWQSLKALGLVSPLNFVESMAVNPESAEIEMVNWLKGSWNLGLFAEGWALAQPGISRALQDAVAGIPQLAAAWETLFPGAAAQPEWQAFSGLPPSAFGYVFTSVGERLVAADTTPGGPRLWVSDRMAPDAIFTELPFEPALLNSAWTWPRAFTSIVTMQNRVFVASSAGIFEVNPNAPTNVLTSLWGWSWDTARNLRAEGDQKLLWEVSSFGNQSGRHSWDPAGGFRFLSWSQAAVSQNKIVNASTGEIFGWTDSRGFMATGAAPPPLLLEINAQAHQASQSTDGSTTWELLRNSGGEPLDAGAPVRDFGGLLFAVDGSGKLHMRPAGKALFQETGLQSAWPNTTFYDETSGLLIAGGQDGLFAAALAHGNTMLHLPAGGAAKAYTLGAEGPLTAGYAAVTMEAGSAPYGTAVFSYRQNGVVVSEAGVPPSPPTRAARFFVECRANAATPSANITVLTGLAVVNANDTIANLSLKMRDPSGAILSEGAIRLLPGEHLARFLDQLAPDFELPPGFLNSGVASLDITADQPVSVLAMRLTGNQRGDVLLSTTPVVDMSGPAAADLLAFAQVADGGGYRSSLIFLNTSSTWETGVVAFHSNSGAPLTVGIDGWSANTRFAYSIAPGGLLKLTTDGSPASANVGWARLIPNGNSLPPASAALFEYTRNGVLVSEAGVPAVAATTRARIYVDMSGNHDTGLAVANPGSWNSRVVARAFEKDGVTPAGSGSGFIDLDSFGHDARFAWQLIPDLPPDFEGVLDITASNPFVALTLRSLTNERGDFLVTTFPLADASRQPPAPVIFPQIASGGGYETQIILLDISGSPATCAANYFGNDGAPIAVAGNGSPAQAPGLPAVIKQ